MSRFQQLYDWIDANKPKVIVEIGAWNGHNAVRMIKEAGGEKVCKYVGFDLWEDGDEMIDELENNAKKRVTLEEVQKFLKQYDAELIRGNTRETIPVFVKDKKPFVDMVLIDGGHSKGTIKSDLLNIMSIVNRTGTIFLDDYYFGCPTPNVGAQTVMEGLQIPYTVLPKADRANDGSVIKIVKISMKDVPMINQWDVPEEKTYRFNPEAAA